ncbi:calcium-dependent lipid-binding family protein [Striga asiatica]|uniref:Calcium-dependent lipid-binding family protein n=1 Tax=Striga asiatica TaxID=4170 RepID=A0A5A7R1M8_STRAF|nr:calcium-dependent lipid-binding family protein [Striga asiatica]
MGFLSSLLGIFGFAIGLPLGVLIGFYLFIFSESKDVEDPEIKPLCELDTVALDDLMPEIPLWVKSPDYDRVDWLNKFISEMWPFLDTAICSVIRRTCEPIFGEYIGKFKIESIGFMKLSLGDIPPTISGLKVCETNEKELVMEPSIRWAGNPNIVVAVTFLSVQVTVQLVDVQVFAAPRITFKPLVPTIPCFANIIVSLMEKPFIDFGVNVLGGDIMSIPGLYRYVQERIKREVASLYLWPKRLDIPVLDASTVAIKKPVGILHVKVVRAVKLLKMDLLGLSDPYVKLSLSGEKLSTKKTTIKKKTLNPEWNEDFKISVKEPQTQMLLINIYDWDKVGSHDRLGTQNFPLKMLAPNEPKQVTLDLLKDTNITETHNKKQRGKILLELVYAPFREDSANFSGLLEGFNREDSLFNRAPSNISQTGAGLLLVNVQGAHDVEGSRHNNPYVVIIFRGETKKSKVMMKKTRNPLWNEEFQFLLEEPPLQEKIHIKVMSKRTSFSLYSKESLGYVDINLADVVNNGRLNQKYHLIESKNGVIHVELRWKTI